MPIVKTLSKATKLEKEKFTIPKSVQDAIPIQRIWSDGIFQIGSRDEGLLESALAAPFQTFGGEPVYPSLQAKAAQLGFGLIRNHPFVDGNKRIGAHTMLVFLAVNGIELRYEQQELIDIVLSVAAGQIDRQGLLQWILDHE